MRLVGTVFRKEMIETLRDRRTIIVALLLPVVMVPVVTLGIPYLAQRQKKAIEHTPARVVVTGRVYAPELVAFGVTRALIRPIEVAQPIQALTDARVDAVLEIPSDFTQRLAAGRAVVTVIYNTGETSSLIARQRIQDLLASYSAAMTEGRLRARGLSSRDLAPIAVQERTVADERHLGGALLAGLLPFFISLWAVLGGQYAALDLGAGEKERRTLETLLVTPPSRWVLAGGKCGAVAAVSMAAVVVVMAVTLVSLRLGAAWGLTELQRGMGAISMGRAVLLCVVAFVLVIFLSALQLALSVFARSMREAQQYFTPVYLAFTLPAMATQFLEGWGRWSWTYLLPGLNAPFAFRALLLGTVHWGQLSLTVLSTALYAAMALWLAVHFLRQEPVVNRG